ncbi:BTAD domain-containing putative transcriptional regulator [Streptomyces sp. NPDC007896]|uniref:AfsR/SARP family transcriptional regulator n=1 Tax=Streptomyces sp. NPDC007896 TaxID=3364784 RepID=UPI0036E4F311
MRFRLLGPLEVHPQVPSAAKQRTILARLLMDAGRMVSTDSLIEELWGAQAPRTARSTLQVYVSQLRKTLAVGGATALLTRAFGYQLDPGAGELDLHCFQELSAAGDRSYTAGAYEKAAGELTRALALWRGPALADVPQGTYLRGAVDRLELLHLDVQEQRISADIWLGRHRQVISELTALARAHPLRESLHAHLIVALYRAQQTSEALARYAALCTQLADELGTDPGPALRELHLRIVRSAEVRHVEECLTPRSAPIGITVLRGADPAPLPTAPVGHLPRMPKVFVGRGKELAEAEAVLRDRRPGILVVTGGPGVGTSTAAAELAHRTAGAFPDGLVFLSLRSPDGGHMTTGRILALLLRKFAPERAGRYAVPELGVQEMADLLATVLEGRRVLLVLDDVHHEAQVRPLTVTDATLLLTTRRPALALEGAVCVPLGPLTPDDSVALLSGAAGGGADAVRQDPETAGAIAAYCEHLPLALRAAAAWFGAHPSWPARVLLTRLRDPATRLDALAVGDLDIRARLTAAADELPSHVRRAFGLLSLAPSGGFEAWAAIALLDEPTPHPADEPTPSREPAPKPAWGDDAALGTVVRGKPAPHAVRGEKALETLFQTRLLDARTVPDGPVRYRMNGLAGAVATELLAHEDPDGTRTRAAVERLSAAYTAHAWRAMRLLLPSRRPARPSAIVPDQPGFASAAAALLWFREECDALADLTGRAHEAGLWTWTGALAESLVGYCEAGFLWKTWSRVSVLALDAARHARDPRAEAIALCSRGSLAWQRGQADLAAACFDLAYRRARQASHRHSEVLALIGLADTEYGWGHFLSARHLYSKALALSHTENHQHSTCDALRGLVLAEAAEGHLPAALKALSTCAGIARAAGDRRWSCFLERLAHWLTTDFRSGGPIEVRPGVWHVPAHSG